MAYSWRMLNGFRRSFATEEVRGRLAGIPKSYNPIHHEAKIMQRWKNRKRRNESETNFRMILPPPNVTGKLHLGHALTVAIQDTIIRLKTMRGATVEWIPGFDHAGIATHSVVRRKLQKTSTDSRPVHPTYFQKELEDHSRFNRESIKKQLEVLGALLDWDKEYYTLDPFHSDVVSEAFIHLFEAGVIRRGNGLVNWCYALQSTIADIEVDEVEFNGRTSFRVPGYDKPVDFGLLYYCAYKIENSDQNLVVATSRPETMFGDVAVAVHPDDTKYSALIGQRVINPLNGKIIPIIGDNRVKMNFGTGAVKITPAHDRLDFEIGQDNNLEQLNVFTGEGDLNEHCGNFAGLQRFKARKDIIRLLHDTGSLLEVADYKGCIGLCSRTQDIVEPVVLPHWFFQTKATTDTLLSYINNGQFIVRPEYQQNALLHKLSDVRDWCLSRQIPWGHQIPAFHHKDFPGNWVVSPTKHGAKSKLEKMLAIPVSDDDIIQDPDVLDTWFSSALIPLAVSRWPDAKEYKEISLLETGHDILLFWVWRMAIMNLALIDKLPFRSVLLHGIVVDNYGRKMSKSRGNVIDPMHAIFGKSYDELKKETSSSLETGELDTNEAALRLVSLKRDYPAGLHACGADALRYCLLGQDISDQDVTISVAYLENCKHFCNKLWQAMRMYLHYAEDVTELPVNVPKPNTDLLISLPDRWILACLFEFAKTYEVNVAACKFHLVTEAIRTFFYSQYCDVYLELVKKDLQEKKNVDQHLAVMRYVFCTALKFAHPFLPFVTEEIWSVMTEKRQGLLIETNLPMPNELEEFRSDKIYEEMTKVQQIVKEVRSLKSRYFAGSKETPNFYIETQTDDPDLALLVDSITTLTRSNIYLGVVGQFNKPDLIGVLFDFDGGRTCRVSVSKSEIKSPIKLIDDAKLAKLQDKLNKLKQQYESPGFQQNAPPEAKEKLRRKVETLQSRIDEARTNITPDSEHM